MTDTENVERVSNLEKNFVHFLTSFDKIFENFRKFTILEKNNHKGIRS